MLGTPQGYNVVTAPGERALERDTLTCVHCGRVNFTKGIGGQMQVLVFRSDASHYLVDAHFCRGCWGWVCPRKECTSECKHRFKRMEEEEALARKVFACE
jgi:hypothetical protein